jgi:L-alanine-DL-glutamate epimerase-like enolase superfamily enzyme
MRDQPPFIAGIETGPLRIPFKAGTKSDASAWGDSNLPAANSLLVKVTTDQGLVGWGEAFGFRAIASAKLAIDQLIVSLCVGQDATRIETLMLDVQKKLHVGVSDEDDGPLLRFHYTRSRRNVACPAL